MELNFNEQTHAYTLGDKKLLSITQLLAKHKLAPSYDGVDTELLKERATYGTYIHSLIEDYAKNGTIEENEELKLFIDYLTKHNLVVVASEKKLHNDLLAGTCDLILQDTTTNDYIRAEIKTTYSKNEDYVSWQLSCYEELDDLKTQKFMLFHFTHKDLIELEVCDIKPKPQEEVKRLFEAEALGIIYVNTALTNIDKEQLAKIYELQQVIIDLDTERKQKEKELETLKDTIKEFMETHGLKKFENDTLRLTLKLPTTRESLDTKKLKAEHKDIYEQYLKTTQVASSLLITIKEK